MLYTRNGFWAPSCRLFSDAAWIRCLVAMMMKWVVLSLELICSRISYPTLTRRALSLSPLAKVSLSLMTRPATMYLSFKSWSSGLWYDTNVSEDYAASIFRVKSVVPRSGSVSTPLTPCSYTQVHFSTPRSLPWRMRQQGLLKRWYLTTSVHGVKTQKTSSCVFIAVKTSNLVDSFYLTYYYELI
jgi:hypothetical protein